MPVFEIQANGRVFEVEAPDAQSAAAALSGPSSEGEQTPNSGQKGDMRPGSRLRSDLGATTLQGASLNFADEGIAGLATPFVAARNYLKGEGPTGLGEVYDQELAFARDKLQATRDARPLGAPLSEVAGALMTAKAPLNLISKAPTLGKAMITSAGAGATMGGLAGFGAGEGGRDDRLSEAKTGAYAGTAIGAASPVVGALLSRAISPFKTSAARTQMADTLAGEGVDLTAGQRTGSNALRYAESEIGGQKAANMIERQGEQFTSAALKRVGTNADRATPDVIDDTFTRVGQQFDGLAARNSLEPDQKMIGDLTGIVNDYNSLVPESQRAPIIQNVVDDILKTISMNTAAGTNAVKGAAYQSLRSSLDRGTRATKDPQLAGALRGIKDTLDDAMERSIGKNNPADLGSWREARNQYRNLLVIEKAATGAGENAAAGLISPSQLRNATVQQSRRGYARGKGDFASLARAGEATMKPLPNSGTAGRTAVRALGMGIPAAIGGVGGSSAGPLGTMAGMAAGAALPKIVGALMMNKAGQKYLSNQVASSPALRNVVSALITSGSAGRLPTP